MIYYKSEIGIPRKRGEILNVAKLKQKIQQKGLTLYKLSIKSEVAYSTLHDILSGKAKNPRIDTITKIANALEEKVESLIWREVMWMKRVILKIKKKNVKKQTKKSA